MQIITSLKQMQAICKDYNKQGKTIGFVPTMGYLHEGHLTLMKQARVENDVVVTSIFVNPLQFGPGEDFDRYPRDVKQDEQKASEMGVDYFFYPHADDMYPGSTTTQLKVIERNNVLCGKKRVGHFDGVVTVLLKLFNLVCPDRVYMGTKDAQQVAVAQGLVDDYNMAIEIIPVPTVREIDGLAKSSRNVYLTSEERKEAPELYKSLQAAEKLIDSGEKNPNQIISHIHQKLEKLHAEIDYIELYTYPTLQPIEKIQGRIVIAIAVKFSQARLIDNIILGDNTIINA